MKPSRLNFVAGLLTGVAFCLGAGAWNARRHQGAGRSTAHPVVSIGTESRASAPVQARPLESRETLFRRLKSIAGIGDPLDRSRALLAYLRRLQPGDFPSAVQCCHDMGLPDNAEEFEMLYTAWAKADRTAALAAAAERPGAIRAVLNVWAECDPQAAHDWVVAHRPVDEAGQLLGVVIPALARGDSAHAMNLISGLPREGRWYVLHQLAPNIFHQGMDAAERWLAAAPEALRAEATSQFANELPNAEAPRVFQWLQREPQACRTTNIAGIFRTWLGRDRDAAMQQFEALPPGRLHAESMRGLVIEQVTRGDGAAALETMSRFPAEVDDPMIETWVEKSVARDPRQALEDIARIKDDELRDAHWQKAVRRWTQSQPEEAAAWLQAHPPAPVQTAGR